MTHLTLVAEPRTSDTATTHQAAPGLPTAPSSPAPLRLLSLLFSALRRWLFVAGHRLSILFREAASALVGEDTQDLGWFAVCGKCGLVCQDAARLDTAVPCAGSIKVAQCIECVDFVRLDADGCCANSIYHAVANVREISADEWLAWRSA